MWLIWLFGAVQLGFLIYEFSTGRLIGRNWKTWIAEESNRELFWSIYAFQVFGFLVFIAIVVCKFYFKVF